MNEYYKIVAETQVLIKDMYKVYNEVDMYRLVECVPEELQSEVRVTVTKWIKQIKENFDKFFIKQANLEVLQRKFDEVKK